MRRLALGVAVLVMLAGCSSGGGKTKGETFGMPPSSGPTTTIGAGAPRAPGRGGTATSETTPTTRGPDLTLTSFRTPSSNIGCYLQAGEARCDIQQSSFSPPPKPSDCDADWGHAVTVSGGKGAFGCVGDSVFDAGASVLAYGQHTRQGSIVCESAEAGVTCTDEASGHGFFLSRDSYRLF